MSEDKFESNSFICYNTLRGKKSEILWNDQEQAGRNKYSFTF